MALPSQFARLLASHIGRFTNIDTPDTTRNGNVRDLIIQIIGNVSATGGSRLFLGMNSTDVNAPPKVINLRFQVAEALQNEYEDMFLRGIEEPCDGTCSWLLDLEVYKAWRESQVTRLLWLCGPPGCGKTTLASFALRDWKENFQNTHTAGYFFFNRQYDKAKSPLNFLSAIIHQLMQLYPLAGELIEDICGPAKLQSVEYRTSSYEGLWSILIQVLDGLSKPSDPPEKPLIYVLDAIDESSDTASSQFLQRLYKEVYASKFPVKMLITCRRVYIDRLHGQGPIPNRIDIDHENTSDIAKYVHGELCTWYSMRGNADVAATLERAIIYRAEGIFLWVVLIVEGLLGSDSKLDTVLGTIHSFPQGKDEKLRKVYEEILKQATNDFKEKNVAVSIKSILSIVITSATPLTIKELEVCLAAGGSGFGRFSLELDITYTCRGLLKIEEGVVLPFHTTLKTYLEDGKSAWRIFISTLRRHTLNSQSVAWNTLHIV